MPDKRRVVITGIGAVTPLGVGARPLHLEWAAGVCAIEDGAGRCSSFEPRDFLSVKEMRRLDRVAQFAVVAADEAVRQAGWADELPYDPMRIGCVIATGIGGISTVESNHDVMRERGASMVSPLGIPMYMPNAPAAAVSMRHKLQGQMYGVVSACSGGAHAIGSALRMIQYGDADAVVAGGAEATLTEFGFACFNALQALSETGVSRPFDARRDGFVMGEGGAILILEELEAAHARGAHIYCEIVGYGTRGNAYHMTGLRPEAYAMTEAILDAMRQAQIKPEDIDYVNAHGSGTKQNDRHETAAYKKTLGEHAYKVPISSIKSMIGHSLGAIGSIEMAACALAIDRGVVPPTANWETRDPECDLDYTPNVAVRKTVRTALSTGSGFGGFQSAMIFSLPQELREVSA